jgi:Carboxypeptidase regulatory-like domain
MLNFTKPLTLLRATVLGVAVGTLMACGGGSSPSTATTPTPTSAATPSVTYVSGIVKNGAGNPLAGALVLAAGQTATTGADGSYKLDASSAGDNTVVLVKKPGFTTTAKEVPLVAASTTQIDIAMFADQVSTTFSAATAANIAVNGAAVQIPANSIKTANGADFTGTVSVGASYYSPDTAQGAQAFAAPYTGTDAGVQSSIVSMGFMEVKLTDAAGNPLQLKAPATLTFPASSNSANAATVPLWFYDEAAKIWKREGQATRQPDGTYQGSVAHFTIWNADFFGISATLKGCFRDNAGLPVTNVGFTGLRGTGWSHLFSGISTDGNFQINLVPANMPIELYSAISPASFAAVAIPALAPGEVRQLPCTTATVASSSTILQPTTTFVPTGTPSVPTGSSTASFAGVYTGTYSGAEVGTFSVTINAAGVVSGSNFSQTYQQTFRVTGQVNAGGSLSLTAAGSAGSAAFGGSISSTGAVSGTWRYVSGLTGSGTFTGQRN